VSGVAFIKKGWMKMGLIIAHEGMLIDQKILSMRHQNSVNGKL
jgi:hypothetical protein